jgi:hypothetical protein
MKGRQDVRLSVVSTPIDLAINLAHSSLSSLLAEPRMADVRTLHPSSSIASRGTSRLCNAQETQSRRPCQQTITPLDPRASPAEDRRETHGRFFERKEPFEQDQVGVSTGEEDGVPEERDEVVGREREVRSQTLWRRIQRKRRTGRA